VIPIYHKGLIYEADCAHCPLRGKVVVPPDGIIPAKLVLVGEEPGEQEVTAGRTFVGPTGNLLWRLCEARGLPPREQLGWVTNARLCRSSKIKLSTGAILQLDQVREMAGRACRKRLLWEINYVTQGNPKAVILALGKTAAQAVLGMPNAKIFDLRGSLNQLDLEQTLQGLR
jgi:uracil-DNA glycosylase family 4